jgi:signal transduction histidine kinase
MTVLRRVPGALLVVAVLGELAAVLLSWGLEPLYDTVLNAVYACAMAGAGALILGKYPRHPIGWLMCALGLANVLSDLPQGYGLRAAEQGWPGGPLAEWMGTATWLFGAPLLVLTFILFPTGHPLSRRWLAAVWLSAVGAVIGQAGWSLSSRADGSTVDGQNPYAVPGLPTDTMFAVGLVVTAATMLAALVAVTLRLRASHGVERQQLKWFALATGALAVTLPVSAALWDVSPVVRALPLIALTAWTLAIGVAILRYRLYDLDLIVSRAFAYAALTLVLAAVYVWTVIVLGAVVGRGSAWVTAGATFAAAAVFKLIHRRLQDAVDRRFRPAHHDALDTVTRFLDELHAGRAEPEQVVGALREALRDPALDVRLVGAPDQPPEPDDVRDSIAIERGGVLIGHLRWAPVTEEQHLLAPAVLDAASLAVEMARLRVELRKQLDEVAASRARIEAAAEAERRRIERDLHDGAQQRLVSIGLALRHAQHEIGRRDETARRTIDGAVDEITAAIDELRDLAHGLRPSLLHAGLGPALRDLASRSPVPVEVAATATRYPSDIEAAAYFVACEGLTNAVKHARAGRILLEVRANEAGLTVRVTDDGVGGAAPRNGSGLTGLSDRVAARGGRLLIDSSRGTGTSIVAELPCVS